MAAASISWTIPQRPHSVVLDLKTVQSSGPADVGAFIVEHPGRDRSRYRSRTCCSAGHRSHRAPCDPAQSNPARRPAFEVPVVGPVLVGTRPAGRTPHRSWPRTTSRLQRARHRNRTASSLPDRHCTVPVVQLACALAAHGIRPGRWRNEAHARVLSDDAGCASPRRHRSIASS